MKWAIANMVEKIGAVFILLLFQHNAYALTTSTTINFNATIQAAACSVNGSSGISQTVDFGTADAGGFGRKGKVKVPLLLDCSHTGAAITNVDVTVTPSISTGYWSGNELKLQASQNKQVINDYSLKLYYEDKATDVVFSKPHQVTLSKVGVTDASLWAEFNQRSSLTSIGAWNAAVNIQLTYN